MTGSFDPSISSSPDVNHVRRVRSFHELAATPFTPDANALCWPRPLTGDFGEIVQKLGAGEGIVTLDEARLLALPVSPAGAAAVAMMLEDLRRLRAADRDPVLNCIHAYPQDEATATVATDVFSFHADSAPVAADTWLCTYHGAPSEGVRNEDAVRRVDVPQTRAQLLAEYGGADNADFQEYLKDNSYDLHYAPAPHAQPYSFGLGHLWRIAVDYPNSPVPPCIHRAPATVPGQPRLLLIS